MCYLYLNIMPNENSLSQIYNTTTVIEQFKYKLTNEKTIKQYIFIIIHKIIINNISTDTEKENLKV